MKICPRCQKTYADDNLNFCLEDGAVLAMAGGQSSQSGMVNEPTLVGQADPRQPGTPVGWNPPQPQRQQQYSAPPKKSSKTWIWALLALGVVVVLCGGGLLGVLAYIGSQVDKSSDTSSVNKNPNVTVNKSPSSSTTSSTTTTSTSGRSDLTTVDLGIFVKEFSLYGTTVLNNGELTMGSNEKRFYYVLVAPDDYKTENADTKVTLRNIENASGNLGYGLIFHSNPQPLQQDYAFLIDTKRKKYRVVHHAPQKETSVITWTSSPAIKEGTGENTLEVHDLDDKIELYINGTMVTSIKNLYGYPGGVVGLYAGDGVKVAFKDLEIRK